MPKLTGNKGEWSEIYVFLRLLEIGKLYAADSDLNKVDDVFYNIINIVRKEKLGVLEFRIYPTEDKISVYNTDSRTVVAEVPCSEFKRSADELYTQIIEARSASFSSDDTEKFLDTINVSALKAKSMDKADIHIRIHDINTGFEAVQGFSIKSRLGSPSTLINAGKTTNFIYEITGDINDDVAEEFNSCSKLFKDKFAVLENHHCDMDYLKMENEIFENNLILVDGDLPKITSELLKLYYRNGCVPVKSAVEKITQINPIGYNLSGAHPFYEYKFKALLRECALGMLPSKVWTGKADATGGYIVVREDGEVLCYHLFNMNEFENYLLNNTKFETASTHRHDFGHIYKENNRYYLKLNLQVRFIK